MFAPRWNVRYVAPLSSAVVVMWATVGAAQFVQPKTTHTTPAVQSSDDSTTKMADALWQQFGLKLSSSPAGNIIVEDVAPASLCARAGIEKGDEIAKVNDAAASGPESVARPMLSLIGSARTMLTLRRAGRTFEATVALNPANASPAGPSIANAPVPSAPEGNVFGMFVHQEGTGPVVVDSVSPLSPAEKAGIRPGDMLLSVGGYPAAPVNQMMSAVTDLMTRRQPGTGIPAEI
ncbi:MAG TPA: PDZ domain-containing protein, partial [Pirellulales bacterium]|nr:PDZ domain-containing protein [Pirellulales bacterium]